MAQDLMNNDEANEMRWVIEVATQEYNGSIKTLFQSISTMRGC